ncbi:hypothetical protein Acr_23g0011490 [Actinidia rufa]|uniref:Uncharacterized protein n=1 Tax=Actinidia rufa TaxID=165716 RepID=A0A7J0GQ69_9ERIC|nr:hypothetical protein Acr_23g0011490 [Actinidia rufa]
MENCVRRLRRDPRTAKYGRTSRRYRSIHRRMPYGEHTVMVGDVAEKKLLRRWIPQVGEVFDLTHWRGEGHGELIETGKASTGVSRTSGSSHLYGE